MAPFTTEEFLSTIRAKYPAYNDVEDSRLLDSFLKKYPVYKPQISDLTPDQPLGIPAPTLEPETPVAATVGTPTAIPEDIIDVRFGAASTTGEATTRFFEKVNEFVQGDQISLDDKDKLKKQLARAGRELVALPLTLTAGFANALLNDPKATAVGFAEGIKESFNNFTIFVSPLSTPEQKKQAQEYMLNNPLGFAFTTAILTSAGKGVAKKIAAPDVALRAAIEKGELRLPTDKLRGEVVKEPIAQPVTLEPSKPPAEVTTRIVPGIKGGVKVAIEQKIETPVVEPQAVAPQVVSPEVAPTPPPAAAVPARVGGVPVAKEPIIGLNKREIAQIRKETGLNDLPTPERLTWESVLSEAKVLGKDKTALETATIALRTKQPIENVDHAGMVLKIGELANEYDVSIAKISSLIEKGEIGASKIARVKSELIIENMDRLTEASDLAGTAASRALGIRRMLINRETYQLAHVVQRAQVSKGSKLSTKETARIEQLVAEQSKFQDQLKQAETAYTQLLAERDRLAAENVTKGAVKRRKKVAPLEALLSERADLKSQLTALGFRVNDVTGITAEGSFLVGKLAVNYIKEGAITLSDVVGKVRRDVPSLTERDVHQSLIAKDPRRQAKARSDVTKRIADLKTQADLILKIEKAEKGVFDLPKGKSPRPVDIRILQRHLRDLRAQAYKSGMHPSQLERAISTINSLQDQLTNQYRTVRQKRTIESPDLASAREKAREIRKELNVENSLASLNEQLRTGEFVITERVPLKEIPPSLERKQIELKRARRQIRVAIDEMAPLTAGKLGVEAINTLRTLKATADMSATLRQGLILSIRRPVMATKAFGKSFKAFFSEFSAERVDNAIRSADHHYLREKAGLQLTEVGGLRTAREEMFSAQMIEKLPIIGEVVKASNRHMTTHLNLLRVGAFDQFLAKFPNATSAELTAWADWVNVASGRGDLGRAASVANTLSLVVFAPRFAVSRIQTPYMMFKHWKTPRVRAEIAKDMAGFVGIGMTALALADLAGFEVGLDPRNPDFGKIRIGDTRIDIWAGVQQPVRVVARVLLAVTDKIGITGAELTKREKDVDPLNLIGRFAAYKLAPSVTIPLEILKGKTIVGEPVTPTQTAARAVLPLWMDDVADAYRQEGVGKAALVGGLTFLGIGASTYGDSETQTRRKIRKMKFEFNYAGADQLKFEWNMRNPGNPIRNVSGP